MKKGIGGMIVSLIMLALIAAIIPMAAGFDTFCISGYKYDVTDGTDKPLNGWTIKVTYYVFGIEMRTVATTTDPEGHWEICKLDPGDYVVTEVIETGWTQTYPLDGSYSFDSEEGIPTAGSLIFRNKQVTPPPGTGTPGYWKNHPDAWPVDNITIGGVTYPKDDAIGIMKKPVKRDMTYAMFQALVAAKLNVEMGNDASCIMDDIVAADNWMSSHHVGSNVKAKDSAWQDGGEALKDRLDAYNNGKLCAPARD